MLLSVTRRQIGRIAALLVAAASLHVSAVDAGAEAFFAAPSAGRYLQLIDPLTDGGDVDIAGWRMGSFAIHAIAAPDGPIGLTALQLQGQAHEAGSKGDATITDAVSGIGVVRQLRFWSHPRRNTNVASIGIQVVDAEGESFIATQPAEKGGDAWRRVDFDLSDGSFEPAWNQPDKSGRIRFPLAQVNIVWFAEEAGPSAVTLNGLVAVTDRPAPDIARFAGPGVLEPGQPLGLPVVIAGDEAGSEVDIAYTLQRDPRLRDLDRANQSTAGPRFASGRVRRAVPERAFDVVNIEGEDPLGPGAYLLTLRAERGDQVSRQTQRLFVLPERLTAEQQAASPIGLNSSRVELAPLHQRLGIGWVRFENLKWPMVSPEPGRFVFDGVPPWYVDHDRYMRTMAEHNIKVLPFLFHVPPWASSAPEEADRRDHYPPADYEAYGEFVFQTVARFGSRKHDPATLQTDDGLSGLGLIDTYELWNEPNLNEPGWGHWIGELDAYFEMMRVGAEAAKRADPTVRIANAGFAGITPGLVDTLRRYEYADGKRPLDFIDVLSVHTYTGEVAPERSAIDTNVDREGATGGSVTHAENLRRLADWRDQHRPEMPIWMTETGYDTGGPRGVNEREQAAYNVRNTLMMLAAGIDKVIIYRESGSAESLYAASGLLRDDRSYKPSWFSVATLIRQLGDADDFHRLPHPDDDIYLYAWRRDGGWIVAAWCIQGEKHLNLDWGGATITDTFGGVTTFGETNVLTLSELPVYLSEIADEPAVVEHVQQSRAAVAEWRQERRARAELQASLFDFGSRKHVATLDLGGPRWFTPVLAEDLYDEQTGYGFLDQPADADNDAHWIDDPAERTTCRVKPGSRFRFDLEGGEYELAIGYRTTGADLVHTIHVDGQAIKTPAFTGDRDEARLAIEIDQGPIVIEFSGYGDVAWIAAVKSP
ncbi:MAG: hypothetical protein WD294_15560 [Phycisphaeraceae bacterium]